MKIIFFLLIGIYVSSLIFKLIKSKQKFVEENISLDEEKEALERGFKKETEKFHKTIAPIIGREDYNDFLTHQLYKNMPDGLRLYHFGREIEKTEWENSENHGATYFYEPIQNARSNASRKYKLEIYSTNSIVTDWSKLS